ncbi:hypothetical protein CSA37_04135 [Candidatus Fermentibacteria bacterium]|nr:MAG: hypothetical protein CSA37_04135 [Candidatus Fermentibacteria bacterium]
MTIQAAGRSSRWIKEAARLKTPSGCRKRNRYLVEGPRFIGDMIRRENPLLCIIVSSEPSEQSQIIAEQAVELGIRVIEAQPTLYSGISYTEHSQGITAIAEIPSFTIKDIFNGGTVLALDGIGDPGNAGTAIRSAAAFGCSGVVFLRNSTFPWAPKVVRSSAGLVSAIPVTAADSVADMALSFPNYRFFGADASGKNELLSGITAPVCLVIGSEAHGLSEKQSLHGLVSIPMEKNVESLNAGVSASILLWQLYRSSLN